MDLTGIWIGRYEPSGSGPVIPFEAEIVQGPDGFGGLMIEPDPRAGELRSHIEGSGTGTRVTFRKCWIDADPGDDAVHSGLVASGGLRIVGRWWFPLMSGGAGRFSMMRAPARRAPMRVGAHRARN